MMKLLFTSCSFLQSRQCKLCSSRRWNSSDMKSLQPCHEKQLCRPPSLRLLLQCQLQGCSSHERLFHHK
jgi:hypothetical protein